MLKIIAGIVIGAVVVYLLMKREEKTDYSSHVARHRKEDRDCLIEVNKKRWKL